MATEKEKIISFFESEGFKSAESDNSRSSSSEIRHDPSISHEQKSELINERINKQIKKKKQIELDSSLNNNDNQVESQIDSNQLNCDTNELTQTFNETGSHSKKIKEPRKIIRKFRKLDLNELTASPAPDVKIGQRVAYKEYYGNEFGTIRWIGKL